MNRKRISDIYKPIPIETGSTGAPETSDGLDVYFRWRHFLSLIRELSPWEKADYWRCYRAAKAGTATARDLEMQAEYHAQMGWEGAAP